MRERLTWGKDEQGMWKGVNEQVRFNVGLKIKTDLVGKAFIVLQQHVQEQCLDKSLEIVRHWTGGTYTGVMEGSG